MPRPQQTSNGKVDSQLLSRQAREVFGVENLRRGQKEVMEAVLQGASVLALMPSGAGKSLCYQLPAMEMQGTTLVISPLLALMKDQLDKLRALGRDAAEIDSSLNTGARAEALDELSRQRTEFIFTTPEQLSHPDFIQSLGGALISLVVVDEAHCISEWGHDFRPAYLGIGNALKELNNPPVLALTATATKAVVEDIKSQLAPAQLKTVSLGVFRDNLRYEVLAETSDPEKQRHIDLMLRELDGAGLIYCATVKAVNSLADFLGAAGHQVLRYHGKMKIAERNRVQDSFMAGGLKAVVATNAFGMGIDKPDVRFVIHYNLPGSIEAYYQESGRAGRDRELARCVLMYRLEDRRIQAFFAGGSYPDLDDLQQICDAIPLVSDSGMTAIVRSLHEHTGMPLGRIKAVIPRLKRAGIIRQRRNQPPSLNATSDLRRRLDEIASEDAEKHKSDKIKLEQMMEYGQIGSCRWKYIVDYFGETVDWESCGNCDNCLSSPEDRIGKSERRLI